MPVFHAVRAPTAEQFQALLTRIIKRIMKLLTRIGYLIEEQGMAYLTEADPDIAPGTLAAGGLHLPYCVRAPRGPILSLQTVPSQAAPSTPQRCVNAQGFGLHAEVRCAINQRHKLEHLCRYITRPAIANARILHNRWAMSIKLGLAGNVCRRSPRNIEKEKPYGHHAVRP
ncbi:MAG: transposase [Gammaproteobacteria bacterium]